MTSLSSFSSGRREPRPRRPWLMRQSWLHVLFAHWPVETGILRQVVPACLEIDTFDGVAWVGVVPFTMEAIRFAWCPPLPGLSAFHELNVRTYVKHRGRPGVWFLSLDAASRVNVWGARTFFRLPYYSAAMSLRLEGSDVSYSSVRRDCRGPAATLRVRYGPLGAHQPPLSGSLEEWLTERYRLFTLDRRGSVRTGEIDHPPWELSPAWAELEENSMASAAGVPTPGAPASLLHVRRQNTFLWSLAPDGL